MTSAFTCPRCLRVSTHPTDLAEGYCGACHDWTGPPGGIVVVIAETTTGGAIGITEADAARRPGPDSRWDVAADDWTAPT